MWFNACIRFLREGKPVIDGNEIDLGLLYQGSEAGTVAGIGMQGILFSLSESNVFGDIDKTSNSNLYDVMARLYQLKADYENEKSKAKIK